MKHKIFLSIYFPITFLFFTLSKVGVASKFDPIIKEICEESQITLLEPRLIPQDNYENIPSERETRNKAFFSAFKDMGLNFLGGEPDPAPAIRTIEKLNKAHDDIIKLSHRKDLINNFITYTNQENIDSAKVIFFPEHHINAESKLETFAMMKQLMDDEEDVVVLLEGCNLIHDRKNWISAIQNFTRDLACTREFNKKQYQYTPNKLADINAEFSLLGNYESILQFQESWLTKDATGWDCLEDGIYADNYMRNACMIESIEAIFKLYPKTKRVLVKLGGLHEPHYNFACYRHFILSCHHYVFCAFANFFYKTMFNTCHDNHFLEEMIKIILYPRSKKLDDEHYEKHPNASQVVYEQFKKADFSYAVIIPRTIFTVLNIPQIPNFLKQLNMEKFLPEGRHLN